MRTADYRYELPEERIAQRPVEPRDASRLLDTRDMTDHRFSELPGLLRSGDLLVVNETRVRRARLFGTKAETGGAVEALLTAPVGDGRWEALVRPARRLRVGTRVEFGDLTGRIVDGPTDGRAVLVFDGDVEGSLDEVGAVPLPPYVHELLDDDERYQTVYATRIGSAAAPTAGLHFTEALLDRLVSSGIAMARVELQVGLDTFRPISADRVEDHVMHAETVRVPESAVEAVADTRRSGGRVVAVGTTVVRSLEAASADGGLRPMEGPTDLFIAPGYRFRTVDLLVTNFHAPGTSLLVLLAAFMGERWREAYRHALRGDYRFLSFGDAMLAERA
ncbi:MAG: tRNA preQ1(34) S-adenosylmethionine ribosyltransferase-isomerase QueA [Acidimicrobiia bacterium]|nr:tRNA preQ1(34) S-adenosylmethionine ribosyltransferase-isomerase QueA [Acidimicrobiia bacterium]